MEEIVITGSRIKRMDLNSGGPVTILDAPQIAATGVTSLEVSCQVRCSQGMLELTMPASEKSMLRQAAPNGTAGLQTCRVNAPSSVPLARTSAIVIVLLASASPVLTVIALTQTLAEGPNINMPNAEQNPYNHLSNRRATQPSQPKSAAAGMRTQRLTICCECFAFHKALRGGVGQPTDSRNGLLSSD